MNCIINLYTPNVADCIEDIVTECPECRKLGDNSTYHREVKIIEEPKLDGKMCSPSSQMCHLSYCPDYCEDKEGSRF